jgi:hypothetical protein
MIIVRMKKNIFFKLKQIYENFVYLKFLFKIIFYVK